MKTVIMDRSAIFASRPRGLVRIAIFSFLSAGTMEQQLISGQE
jgi:hypothetical protein